MSQPRVFAIDILRGLTIFTMVFVNDLASVTGIPAWMKHVPPEVDGMTFVDVVFPAFLFIVGMSIPYAVARRLAQGNLWAFWGHAALRTGGLLLLGFYMVNSEEMNPSLNPIPKGLWDVLLYSAAFLIWNRYPTDDGRGRLYLGLRLLGFAILAVLPWLFHKGPAGAPGYMTPSWWGILGLIGWAYAYGLVGYMAVGQRLAGIAGLLALLVVMVLGLRSPDLALPAGLDFLRGQAGNLSHASLVVAGILLARLLQVEGTARQHARLIGQVLAYGLVLLVAGYFLRPLGGVSKQLATPTWALYSAAICCALFALIYWLVDVKGWRRWAAFLAPAGSNPLLTYLLPFLYYALAGYPALGGVVNDGLPGILRALVFSLLILGLASLLGRWRLRLQF